MRLAGLLVNGGDLFRGHKANAPNAGARVLHHDDLTKRIAGFGKNGFGKTLDAAVDRTHQWDAFQHIVPVRHQAPADQIGNCEASEQHHQERK